MTKHIATPVARRNLIKNAAGACIATALASAPVAAMADEPAANRICELFGIEKPVISAAMLGLNSPELTAAVSEAGGLGVMQSPTLEDIQAIKALTSKPFAVCEWFYDEGTWHLTH